MKVKEYLIERTLYDVLTNMVSVVSKKPDLEFVWGVIDKAHEKRLISKKEHFRLSKELQSIEKSIL